MEKLFEIGFKFVGNWMLIDNDINFSLERYSDQKSILYAFVSKNKVMYVGKTKRTLRERMHNYKNPGKDQKTNI